MSLIVCVAAICAPIILIVYVAYRIATYEPPQP